MTQLNQKTAFITGAANGIGATIARVFVNEGAKVLLVDRDATALENLAAELNQGQTEPVAVPVVADITDRASVDSAVGQMKDLWGRVDILINNAGITRDALTAKMSEEHFDQVIDVNLKGPMVCVQAVFPTMKEQGSGAIVNASSVSSMGNVGQANYAASKAGLIAMTKTWAMEFARFQIRVNAVAPGFTDTAMMRTIPGEVLDKIVSKVPLRRLASTEEIAKAYLFLASDQSSFVTGQTLFVDGGLTCGF